MTGTPTVSVRDWTDVVRRARLGKTVKAVALMMATYADFRDGSRIHPGLKLLAVAAEMDRKTVQSAVSRLVEVGLLEIVQHHPGRRGGGAEYRLTLHPELLDRVEVLSPSELKTAAWEAEKARRRSGRTGMRPSARDAFEEPEPVDNTSQDDGIGPAGRDAFEVDGDRNASRFTPPTDRNASRFSTGMRPVSAPPLYNNPLEQPTGPNPHTSDEVRTAVTPSRETAPVDNPDSRSCPVSNCVGGIVFVADADSLERCEHPSHAPPLPSNVIPFPRTA